MAWRFRKSFKLLPGVRVNVGKKSASLRVGGRNVGYTVSTTGRHTKSASVPGSGLGISSRRRSGALIWAAIVAAVLAAAVFI